MSRSQQLAILFCVIGACLSPSFLRAEITRREANQLAVDVVALKVGGEVRGVILERTPTRIDIAVRREWMEENQPSLLKSLPRTTGSTQRYAELVERIDAWLVELGAEQRIPYSPEPERKAEPEKSPHADLIRVIQAERDTYQEYVDDPIKLPPGEGTTKERQAAYRQLIAKLDTWLVDLKGGPPAGGASVDVAAQNAEKRRELIRILTSERESYARLAAEQPGEEASEFVQVTLSRADVHVIYAQNDVRRQLVLAAFQQDLAGIEQAGVDELQQQLDDAGVDWKQQSVDASTLTSGPLPQSDREWAARKAIYEYQFLHRLDFQGSGNFVTQTGEGAPPPNMGELLQGMLDQQMSMALGDLLEEPVFTGLDFGGLGGAGKGKGEDWLTKATRIAEKQGVRGFRVTRVTPNMQRRQTVVDDRFLARMPDGGWQTIWQLNETKSANDADPDDLERIRQDPQLKQALGLVEGLGLGAGGNLDMALQFGAATMNAHQATDDQFYEFRDRYSQQLAGPALDWDRGP